MTTNMLRIAFVLLTGLLLSGCMVQTEMLLSERQSAASDARLLGVWTVAGTKGETGFVFVREADAGGMDMLSLELHDDDQASRQEPRWFTATVWTSTVGGADYLNLVTEGEKIILAFRMNPDGSAEFGFMNAEAFREAVETGRLEGRVTESFLGHEVTLSDSAANLAAFIRDNGGHRLFVFGEGSDDGDPRLLLVRHRLAR